MRTSQLSVLPAAVALLAAALPAQITATVPTNGSPSNLDRPFPGGIGRYQQWYSGPSLNAGGFTGPVRIDRAEFFAGSSLSANATTIDMEVSMCHGTASGLGGSFTFNYADTPVVVMPRGNVTLAAGAPGAVVLVVNFATRFTWDGTAPLVIEIKIFGNGRGNQPFVYNLAGTTSAFGQTSRLYAGGSAFATGGNVQQDWGLSTRFTGRPGANISFGQGCQGAGGFVPVHTPIGLGWPGINWIHRVEQAASQRLAVWVIGDSNTQWAGGPLPADPGPFLGIGPTGCNILVNPIHTEFTTTIGAGPGAGVGIVTIPMPPTTNYIGASIYTQWLIADPFASNGLFSASQGVWSIIAPVGG